MGALMPWRVLLLMLIVTTVACGPRGPDPAGEPQGPRPEYPGCPELKLRLKDFAFEMDGHTYQDGGMLPPLPSGKLVIVAESAARQVHTLRVIGQGREYTTPVIGVGQMGYLLVGLPAGEYEIESMSGDSRQRGMWARMTVE